jgi:glycosyltransferase involved in cell wall biosynthesis
MGAGVCVLTSDTPENKEAIADAGFTFNAGDGCDLQRMLTVLLSDSRLREAVGKTGQERVRHHFLWDGVVRELAQIYGTLVTPEKRASVIPLTEEQRDTLRLLRPKAPIAR